ncbi:MAG: carboxypeptidase-like regulatory domain-containing protein [Gemmatimonadota bacterium]|nr:carboxypeptidase-like regulatory domain-containing protein [Gemmatimonadota bacterium]
MKDHALSGDRPRLAARAGRALAIVAAVAAHGALPVDAQDMHPDLIRAQCETIHPIADQSIVFGQVTDGRSGLPIPGGTVFLEWVSVSGVADTSFHSASADTEDGAYIFCDVPQNTRLTAYARVLGGRTDSEEFVFTGGESERRDLMVRLVQLEAAVAGTIIDSETGDAVAGATVSLPDSDLSALTNDQGRFSLPGVPLGQHELLVQHLAYGEPRVPVSVENGTTAHLLVRLEPRAIALEPISVEVTRRPMWLETNGFYHRLDRSLGQFVTPEMISRRSFARFSEVLRSVPGLIVREVCAPHCFERIGMAGSTQGGDCLPTFYMDGRRMNVRPAPRSSYWEPRGLIDLDALAAPHDLAAVEVYRSIAETPPEFYGRCGSIVIWTKRGIG